jgi:hypothetical protein
LGAAARVPQRLAAHHALGIDVSAHFQEALQRSELVFAGCREKRSKALSAGRGRRLEYRRRMTARCERGLRRAAVRVWKCKD